MKKPATPALALTGESQPPDWSRARQYLEGIKTFTRFAIAGRILLGHELLTLKVELGFAGRGGDRSKPHDAGLKSLNRTWTDWCKSELGMSDDTVDRAIETYEAAKLKLKNLGGQVHLLGLMETPPAKLNDEARRTLATLVDGLEWGDSLKALMEEFKIFKRHVATTGGDTSKSKKPKPDAAQQLAFAFFRPIPESIGKAVKAVENLRLAPNYKHFLHTLDLTSAEPGQPSLTSLKADLETLLHGDVATALREIDEVIQARMKKSA